MAASLPRPGLLGQANVRRQHHPDQPVCQALTPSRVLGRVNATRRVRVFGGQPIGALAGGLVGEALGLAPAIVLGMAIEVVSVAMLWPLRGVRSAEG
jgi:hypothetical protein